MCIAGLALKIGGTAYNEDYSIEFEPASTSPISNDAMLNQVLCRAMKPIEKFPVVVLPDSSVDLVSPSARIG